jgi:glycine oxidase
MLLRRTRSSEELTKLIGRFRQSMAIKPTASLREPISVSIIGAGIAGAWQALVFARAGYAVTLYERSGETMMLSTSHWAGGMLAPYCEAEAAEPLISRLGVRSLDLWREELPDTPFNGSLVVAHARDRGDFNRFARRTSNHQQLDSPALRSLEPSLGDRFRYGLFFPAEGHVEPRRVLPLLHRRIIEAGGLIKFNTDIRAEELTGLVIDCSGVSARDPELRSVKGEMALVETSEVTLTRPVRLLHPRWPLYVIPREDNHFMLGATSLETESEGISLRSALELLVAAYSVHPAFEGAHLVEFGWGLRPAYPDNLPRITLGRNNRLHVNGLYRHGFLIAPALAQATLNYVRHGRIDNQLMRRA